LWEIGFEAGVFFGQNFFARGDPACFRTFAHRFTVDFGHSPAFKIILMV